MRIHKGTEFLQRTMEATNNPQADWKEVFISTLIYWLIFSALYLLLSTLKIETGLVTIPFIITPIIVSYLFVKKNKRTFITTEAFLTMFFVLSPTIVIFTPALLLGLIQNFEITLLSALFLLAVYTLNAVFLKGVADKLAKVK